MSSESGISKLVVRVVLILAFIALAQYTRMEAQVYVAKSNFRSLGPDLRVDGEKKFKERMANVLREGHFEIDPKDIKISVKPSGTATIDLVASREVKILFYTFEKEVAFHAEPIYDSSL